jgi:hypothetical protein
MGIQDNKTFNLNISGRQLIGIVVTFALCAVAIYANALTIGFIVVTLGLCVFFLAVGFDYGVNGATAPVADEVVQSEPVGPDAGPRPRSGRSARTA